ncbi:MAG TPA: hypothetical protein VFC82_05750 [Actinomycetaceae bacterium]|nr:hypothetical protein [Actinomycetaceae bacterium]
MGTGPRGCTGRLLVRGCITFLLIIAVFTGAVWAVTWFLSGRVMQSANACVAQLPGGERYSLSADQSRNAALIAAIGTERGLPARAVTIALATAMQESKLTNIDYGDRDSVGLFQQRPSQGWGSVEQIMDPVFSTNAFYDALVQLDGYETMEVTVAAQAVQRSAFPDAYARHEPMARAFASSLTGHSPASLACDLREDDGGGGAPQDGTGALAMSLATLTDFGTAPDLTPVLADDGAPLLADGEVALAAVDPAALTGAAIGDPERAVWAAGHWLAATATESGVRVVVVGNEMWTNGTLEWTDAGELTQPNGTVLVG